MRLSLRLALKVILVIGFIMVLNVFLTISKSYRGDKVDEVVPGQVNVRRDGGLGQRQLQHRRPHSISNAGSDSQIKESGSLDGIVHKGQDNSETNSNVHTVQLTTIRKHVDRSRSRPTELSDVFISVKTTKKYHAERLDLLLDTWIMFARDETYIFTDAEDAEYRAKTRGHMINTNCSAVHSRQALCCKMAVEYDFFLASNKRWFCHVDDDTYVNIPALYQLLRRYNHTADWYLGKPSLNHALEITNPDDRHQRTAFWFATGGAGFCISRGLAMKMMPFAAGGKLRSVGEKIRLPDDCTIGFIIYHYLHRELTVVSGFHSHLEGLWMIKGKDIETQLTYSYGRQQGGRKPNIVNMDGFTLLDDPTRFKSIHCILYPNLEDCKAMSR